jgi:hypothetical protein
MVTPYLTTKDIPLIAINHTYDTQEMYSKAVVSGGTGIYYSASTIWIIGRQQEKDGTEVVGYNFVINVEKSRFVKEKSKIPINVSWDGGISTWSGLLDIALESGAVIKPSNGWYQKVDLETGVLEEKKYRAKETNNKEFWLPVLKQAKFRSWVEDTYKIACGQMISDDSIVDELEDIDTEI